MSITGKTLLVSAILAGIAVVAAAGFVWSGAYDVGADDPHTRPVHALIGTLRDRSIEARTKGLQVPDLKSPARIAQGAGNYDAMCTGCHLTPGATATELSNGLYPAPPNLTRQTVEPARAFWVIKHGIKASAMPAWGKSMQDEYIWNMVAFLQELPRLDAAGYKALVAQSGGHSHGGGESGGHSHAGMEPHEHDDHDGHDEAAGHSHPDEQGEAGHHESPSSPTQPAPMTHVHADGKVHVHAATSTAASKPASSAEPATEAEAATSGEPASDEHVAHDHQH